MSTNKTENYGLHAWVPEDDFLLSEINENFGALDEAAWMVTGSYLGDGKAERDIDLGFAPRAVYFCDYMGRAGFSATYSYIAGGLLLPGCPLSGTSNGTAAEITERGFRLYQATYNLVNVKDGHLYRYIALR